MSPRWPRIHSVLLIALAAVSVFALPWVSSASAQEYGPWFPNPQETTGVYDASIEPFNDSNVSEQTTFACVAPDGAVIDSESNDVMSTLVLAASDVFNGNFSFGQSPLPKQGKRQPPANGGYGAGSSGMQAFLRNELALLRSGRWVDYDSRKLQRGVSTSARNSYLTPKPGWSVEIDADAEPLSRQTSRRVGSLVPASASHPLELTSLLPEACALSPVLPGEPSFGKLFSSPGSFITDAILFTPAQLSSALFEFIQPYAFRYTFFTPHTERGDLMWQIPSTCSPTGSDDQIIGGEQVGASCSGGVPLGYDKKNASSGGERAWFLDAAVFLQWLISGMYFLILFTAATLFIFRGNRTTQMNVMHLLPRLLLSIVLTIFAGYIIGAAISTSNLAVQTIFDFNDARAVADVNTLLLQAGNIVGGPLILQQVTQLIVSIATTFFFLVFVLASLARQILLVGLIVLAPLAAFSILSPRWQGNLRMYVRCLAGVIMLPVVLAFILKVGMSINPLVTDPALAYGKLSGVAGLALMLVTLYLMYKSIKLTKDFAVHGQMGISEMKEHIPLRGRTEPLAAGRAPVLGSTNQGGAAQIVPETKQIGPSSGHAKATKISRPSQDSPSLGLDRQITAGPPSGGIDGSSGPPSAAKAMSSFQERRREVGKRISAGAAKKYRNALRQAMSAETASKGRRLKPEEVQRLKSRFARKNGGNLVEQDGAWYLAAVEPAGYEGEEPDERDKQNLAEKLRAPQSSSKQDRANGK